MTLNDIAKKMCAKGKGILAADESTPTMGKRLALIGQENTEENRRDFRQALFDTEGMEEFISGVILFEETLEQESSEGVKLSKILESTLIVFFEFTDSGPPEIIIPLGLALRIFL